MANSMLAEIEGVRHFCWLPTRLRKGAGFFDAGWAWLRWVTKKRYIGFSSYYYTDEA